MWQGPLLHSQCDIKIGCPASHLTYSANSWPLKTSSVSESALLLLHCYTYFCANSGKQNLRDSYCWRRKMLHHDKIICYTIYIM